VKKAKRKAARAAREARETPQDAAEAPAASSATPTPTSKASAGRLAETASNPYIWQRAAEGVLLGSDQLIHAPSGQVVATLDDFPVLKRTRLLREQEAKRRYGIVAAE